jgi:hypothetical protein
MVQVDIFSFFIQNTFHLLPGVCKRFAPGCLHRAKIRRVELCVSGRELHCMGSLGAQYKASRL